MLHFRPGSQAWQLITLLSTVGEFPFRSLRLLGNERVLKALVTKLSLPQTIRNPQTETELTCRLLTVTGEKATPKLSGYIRLPFPYWIGFIRKRIGIIWTHSGTTASPATPPTGRGTTGYRRRSCFVCGQE